MASNLHKLSLPAGMVFLVILFSCNNAGRQNTRGIASTDSSETDSATISARGKQVFANTCSPCHGNTAFPKAPALEALSGIQPQVILNVLDNGKMRQQAGKLTEGQREAVAQFIGKKLLKKIVMPEYAYTPFSFKGNSDTLHDYSGWGGNAAGTGFRTTGQAGISAANVGTLQLKWSFAFPDASEVRSKPAIAGDWLIVGSSSGHVYALNRQTGKIGWQVTATQAIRSGIVVTEHGDSVTAYFADASTYVYAVDVKRGEILWSTLAGQGPLTMNTGTLAVYGGKVLVPISSIEVAVAADSNYNCCTTSGGLAALDAGTGNPLWYHRVIADSASQKGKKENGKPFFGPSGGPVWCSPTVDAKRGLVYIGTGENYTEPVTTSSDAIQAIDIATGKLVWNFQATTHDVWNMACPVLLNCPGGKGRDYDFGMAPILVTGAEGNDKLLVGQKSGWVYALSPADGKPLWKTRIGRGGMLGGIHWGMATDGETVYAANADNKLALNPDDPKIQAAPGIYALNVANGKLRWAAAAPPVEGKESYLAANSSAPAVVPGVVFAGSNDGHIRAYATADGQVLWDYNTMQPYKPVNGIAGNGGSIDCSAPVMADGMLYVNSGYAQFGEKPGNVLLAFAVKQ